MTYSCMFHPNALASNKCSNCGGWLCGSCIYWTRFEHKPACKVCINDLNKREYAARGYVEDKRSPLEKNQDAIERAKKWVWTGEKD